MQNHSISTPLVCTILGFFSKFFFLYNSRWFIIVYKIIGDLCENTKFKEEKNVLVFNTVFISKYAIHLKSIVLQQDNQMMSQRDRDHKYWKG